MHIFLGKSKCIGGSTSREKERERQRERERERERKRDVCVLFEFRNFFNSENSSTFFEVSCRSLQRIRIVQDVLE